MDEVWDWWQLNRAAGRPSVLFCYSLGKAQRILAELSTRTDRAVWIHGAIEPGVAAYRAAGVEMLPTRLVNETERGVSFAGELVLAPPSASGSMWMRRFAGAETAFASGWMQVRGTRRRLGYDRGFVLSDHADWPDLLTTIEETCARRVRVTHGYAEPLARWLREHGRDAIAWPSPLSNERED
jgi:putative mRNA 3-end processing factor